MSFKGRNKLAEFRWNHLARQTKLRKIILFIVMVILVLTVKFVDNLDGLSLISGAILITVLAWDIILFHKEGNYIEAQYKPELNAIRREHGMKEL